MGKEMANTLLPAPVTNYLHKHRALLVPDTVFFWLVGHDLGWGQEVPRTLELNSMNYRSS